MQNMLNYSSLEGQQMSQIPFDTLEYVNTLVQAGLSRKVAEAHAKIISNMVYEKLATKDDIKKLKFETKDDIKDLKLEIKDDIKDLKLETEVKHNELEKRLTALTIEVNNLKNKIDNLETRILVKMSGIIVVALTAFGAIMKLCHF